MSQFGGLLNSLSSGRITTLFTSGGRRRFDAKSLPQDAFVHAYSVPDAVELTRVVVDAKNETQITLALEMLSRMLHENQLSAMQFADQGLCSILDALLGFKWTNKGVTVMVLEVMHLMIQEPPAQNANAPRRKSAGGTYIEAIIPASSAVGAPVGGDVDAIGNTKRVRSFFFGSTTIFRVVKVAQSNLDNESCLLVLLKIMIIFAAIPDVLGKLSSAGICDVASQLLKTASTNWTILALICELIHTLILTDLDHFEGQNRCQDKFGVQIVCEQLTTKVLLTQRRQQQSLDADVAILTELAWPIKTIGTLGRWHADNKKRLYQSGVCDIFPLIPINSLRVNEEAGRHVSGVPLQLGAVFLAESLSWCLANISYPDVDLQHHLGEVGAVQLMLSILDLQRTQESVIYQGCRALRNLCFNEPENLAIALQNKAIDIFHQLVANYENESDVLQWIMYCLATLVSTEEALPALHRLQMVSKIVDILRRYEKNADIVQWTSLVISTLSSDCDVAEQLASMNCCDALAQALSLHVEVEDVAEELLSAIGSLSLASATCRRAFLKTSLHASLLTCLKIHDASEGLVEQTFHCFLGLMHVASETAQIAIDLEQHFSSHTLEAQGQILQTMIPLLESYTAFTLDLMGNTAQAMKILVQVVNKYAKQSHIAEPAMHLLAGLSFMGILLLTPAEPSSLEDLDQQDPQRQLTLQQQLQQLLQQQQERLAATSAAATALVTNNSNSTLATNLSTWTALAVLGYQPHSAQATGSVRSLVRLASSYRAGKIVGSDVLDVLCDVGAVAMLDSVLQAHATTSEPIVLWSLLALLHFLSTDKGLTKAISLQYSLCSHLCAIGQAYAVSNPSLLVLVHTLLIQLCSESSVRVRLAQLLASPPSSSAQSSAVVNSSTASSSSVDNFLLQGLAHHLQHVELVRVSFEVCAVLGLGPGFDALSYICAPRVVLLTYPNSYADASINQIRQDAAITSERGYSHSVTSDASAADPVISNNDGRSRTESTATSTNMQYARPRTNTVMSSATTTSNSSFFALAATRLRRAFTNTSAGHGQGSHLGPAGSSNGANGVLNGWGLQGVQDGSSVHWPALDTLAWDSNESKGFTALYYDTATKLIDTPSNAAHGNSLGVSTISSIHQVTAFDNNNSNANITSSAAMSGSHTASMGAQHMTLAASLLDTLVPLALATLSTYPTDSWTLISIVNGLHSLILDPTCRAQLQTQPEIFAVLLRLLRDTLFGTKYTMQQISQAMAAENSAATSTESLLPAARSYNEAPPAILRNDSKRSLHTNPEMPANTLGELQENRNESLLDQALQRRSVLVALIFHLLASSCLPWKNTDYDGINSHSGLGGGGQGSQRAARSQRKINAQQRRLQHQQRLVFEGEVYELVLYTLFHYAGDLVAVEGALRALHFVSHLGSEEMQSHLANIEVVGQQAQKSTLSSTEDGKENTVYRSPLAPIAIEIVVNALRDHLQYPRIAYYAALAIASLSQNNKMVSLAVGELDGCRALLQCFQRYLMHPEMVEACCQAIFALKYLNSQLGTLGACDFVVQSLHNHPAQASVAEWVCRCIGSLAEYEKNKSDLDAGGVCKVVTSALQRHVHTDSLVLSSFLSSNNSNTLKASSSAAGVAQWGCMAIYYLARGKDAESFQQKLVAAGACDAVARALVKYSEVEAVAQACCRALVVLLFRNDAAKSKLGYLGVCSCVVESLHLFPSSVEVAEWGCRAVAVLSESNEANVAKLAVAGACETIPIVLQSHPSSESVAIAGCDVVAFMSEQLSNGYAERFGHAGACEAVVSVLKKHVAQVRVAARSSIALGTLARVLGNARWFGPAGACDALYQALVVHSQDVRIIKYVVVAIGNLCSVAFNKERLGNLGVCEAVVQVARLHYEDSDTARACAATIWKLCETIERGKLAQAIHLQSQQQLAQKQQQASDFADSPSTIQGSGGGLSGDVNTDSSVSPTVYDLVQQSLHTLAGCQNRAKLFHAGACEALAQCLQSNLGDLATSISCARAVFVLCQGPGVVCENEREAFYKLRMVNLLVQSMAYHASPPHTNLSDVTTSDSVTSAFFFHAYYDDLARYGCLALGHLCGHDSTSSTLHHRGNQRLVQQMSTIACPLLVQILRHYRHPTNSGAASTTTSTGDEHGSGSHTATNHVSVVEGALLALRNVAFCFPSNQSALGEAKACEALLEILDVHGRSLELVLSTVKALFSVCDGHDANRLTLCYSGAAELLTTALTRFLDSGSSNSNNANAINSNNSNVIGSSSSTSASNSNSTGLNNTTNGGSDRVLVLLEYVLAIVLGMAFHPVGRSRLFSCNWPRLLVTQILAQKFLAQTILPTSNTAAAATSSAARGSQVLSTSSDPSTTTSVSILNVTVHTAHAQFPQAVALWERYVYIACLACACLAALSFRAKGTHNQEALLAPTTTKVLSQVLHRASLMNALLQQVQQQRGNNGSSGNRHRNNNQVGNNVKGAPSASGLVVRQSLSNNSINESAPLKSRSQEPEDGPVNSTVDEEAHEGIQDPPYAASDPASAAQNNTHQPLTGGAVARSFTVHTLAPVDCTTTQFLHHRIDLAQEASRALFYLCTHAPPSSASASSMLPRSPSNYNNGNAGNTNLLSTLLSLGQTQASSASSLSPSQHSNHANNATVHGNHSDGDHSGNPSASPSSFSPLVPSQHLLPAALADNEAKRQAIAQGSLEILTSYLSAMAPHILDHATHPRASSPLVTLSPSTSNSVLHDAEAPEGAAQQGIGTEKTNEVDEESLDAEGQHLVWCHRLVDLLLNNSVDASLLQSSASKKLSRGVVQGGGKGAAALMEEEEGDEEEGEIVSL